MTECDGGHDWVGKTFAKDGCDCQCRKCGEMFIDPYLEAVREWERNRDFPSHDAASSEERKP